MRKFKDHIDYFESKLLQGSHEIESELLEFESQYINQNAEVKWAWYLLAKFYLLKLSNVEKCKDYISKYHQSLESDDLLLKAKFSRLEGFTYFEQTDYEKAFECYTQSISILEKLEGSKEADIELGENFINITLLQKSNFDNVSRKMSFTKALNLFEKHDYFYGIGKCNNALGNIYFESKDYDESLKLYHKALKAHQKADSQQGVSVVYNNLGTLHMHLNEKEKAIDYLSKSLALKEKYGSPILIARSYIHFGDIHFLDKNFQEALFYFEKATEICQKLNHKIELNALYLKIGESLEELGRYKEAIHYIKEHIILSNELNQFRVQKEINQNIFNHQLLQSEFEAKVLKEQNEQIQHYVKLLEESNDNLQKFASIASHDLREPLRTIGGHIGLLYSHLKNAINESQAESFQYVINSVNKLDTLIKSLLDYSKIDTITSFSLINFSDMIEHTKLALSKKIEESNAVILLKKTLDIYTSEVLLNQVVQNIIINAIVYNKSDQPIVEINAFETGDFTIITIDDNGIGIPEDRRDEVFQLHRRLEPSFGGGSGIGLAFCRKAVHRMGGDISIEESSLGGTKFILRFPSQKK